MKFKNLLFLLVTVLVFVQAPARAEQVTTRVNAAFGVQQGLWWGWNGWGRAATVWGDHLRFLGQARFLTAQANYTQALAYQQWARARAFENMMYIAQRDLYQIHKASLQAQHEVRKIKSLQSKLASVRFGKPTPGFFQAFYYFEKLPGFYTLPLFETTQNFFGPFDSSQFISTKRVTEGEEPEVVESFPGGDLFEFARWLQLKRYHLAEVPGAQDEMTASRALRQLASQIQAVIATTEQKAQDAKYQSLESFKAIWGDAIWGGYVGVRPQQALFQKANALEN